MATVHLIHGFVGTGKTTFSKTLESEINGVRFTVDEWMIALLGQNPPKEIFKEFDAKIKNLIWDIATKVLQTNTDVILDFGFWKRADRDCYRSLAQELGHDVKLYNLRCPENVNVQRVLQRTAVMNSGTLFIDEQAIAEFKNYYEPINSEHEESLLISIHP